MKTKTLPLRRRVYAGAMFFAFTFRLLANPTGMTVLSGSATAQTSGAQLSITTSQTAFLNWHSFNIAAGERTVFNQPTASSIVFNQIGGQSASQIYGSLQANGIVVLMNSSGFYFGPNSFVSAAGLVVTTANCVPPQNGGGIWEFNGPPPLASIVNYGSIKVGNGGSAYLIADQVENHGAVEAPGGNIGFAAGQTVTLSERPDGRGMSMQVTLPQGSVDNYGNVVADGGVIALNARVVNQNGVVQANSVRNQNGVIELAAADALHLGANSEILAHGDDAFAGSAGGDVALKSGNFFSDETGSSISVAGGAAGGNGGHVEISASDMAGLRSTINGKAKAGWLGGSFLLDPPDYLTLDGGFISSFFGFSSIDLQANYDITLADYTSWNLSDSTGQSSGQLTLEAGGNIIFGSAASIVDANNWSVNLLAGVSDFINHTVQPGVGSIFLDSGDSFNPSFIHTSAGSIQMTAGKDITLGFGFVNTVAGGSISAHALTGDINTGFINQGYFLLPADVASDACVVGPYVGGISTLSGGDVTLTAGGNVASLLPTREGYYYNGVQTSTPGSTDGSAGSGAYGNQPGQSGNVTIVAGGNVTGHYLVANGVGSIFAGVTMDANGDPQKNLAGDYVLGTTGNAGINSSEYGLALSLIKGGWNVTAAHDIYLQEVRNPNGVFNINSGGAYHYFDYAPDAYVNLNAGNLLQLGSTVLPRDNSDGLTVPVIYPSILNITAGDGGVTLFGNSTFNQLILFPSPQGGLTLTTTGSLISALPTSGGLPQIFNLVVSDSGNSQYTASGNFGSRDHADAPIHKDSPTPITLDISGDMNLVSLIVPEAAQINIGGNMINSRFQGMNLAGSDVTTINVGGDIRNSSDYTSVDLTSISSQPGWQAPDFSYFNRAVSSSPSGTTLATSFFYNPDTKTLTYKNIAGKSLADILNLLQNLSVQKVDANGNLLWLDPEQTIPDTETVSVLNAATAQALLGQYLGPAPKDSTSTGLFVGGGGQFKISTANIDLGTSAGIQSRGVGLYAVNGKYPLAKIFNTGADIFVNAAGDLNIFSTSIASLNGGNIYVNAGHDVVVGSSDFIVTTLGARGIFSTGLGNVSVYAGNDINVDGSRIAVYDTRPLTDANSLIPGGNVTVVSRGGNVNVGSGGSGYVVVNSIYADPLTHVVTSQTPTIPGTGILQTSFNLTGNVLVEALMGNVSIGAGGVSQILFKGNKTALDVDGLKHILKLALEGHDSEAQAFQTRLNGFIAGAHTPVVSVYAGYGLQQLDSANQPLLDVYGNPLITAENLETGMLVATGSSGNIDATGSGIVGAGTANLKASAGITGNIFSLGDVNLDANQNINVNVFGLGNVSVASAGGSISGTIIGVGSVSASGGSIEANLESNGSISGDTSGSSGFAQSQSANNVAASVGNDAANDVKRVDDKSDDELKKKKGIALAQKVSRVTVILPPKKISEKSTSNNSL
jgi:filamentous hemagglutinin family protein